MSRKRLDGLDYDPFPVGHPDESSEPIDNKGE